ncbi:hypothetical protein [Phreatobacter oligotrophus]|uniref:Uncharacterized protein n=1 Tax=Phreatobacter oligotrophus TaxID=1122261 RepID=A0A2T4ZI20_9HYPH|nr:hypothetical protein [Phreatobacter oligotrophus]PTM61629.1 hypothetical protein C8P69_101299 [Phreatobacter oligotrophus]
MSLSRRRTAFAAACGIVLAAFSAAGAQAQRAPAAPPAIAAEFRQFIGSFRQAVQANDRSAVTALTRLPMLHASDLHDRAAFEGRVYRQIFTARNRSCLQTARPVYDRSGDGTESYTILCGDMFFLFTKKEDGFRFAETGEND